MCNRYQCFWTLCVVALLFCLQAERAIADSPPNITQDIAWFGDPDSVALPQAYDSVDDIEAAFNNGRRQEENQLNLTSGKLGELDLPAQIVWDALTMQQKALILINAERTARHQMQPDIIGLPLAGIQVDLNTLAQQYAQLLVDANTFTHTQPWPGNPSINTPTERLQNTTVIGSCNQRITFNEGLAAFLTTDPSIPLPVERAIYLWIYADASSNWGHRETLFLQDADLGLNGALGGYKNNVGSNAHEGFLGVGRVGSASYTLGESFWNWGEVVVIEMIDPIANDGCPTAAGRSAMTLDIQRTSPSIVAVGAPVSFRLQLSNRGETLLTDIELTNAFDPNLLNFEAASALTIAQPAAQAQPIPQSQIAVDNASGNITISNLDTLLPHDVLNPIQSASLTVDFIATAQTTAAALAQNKLAATAKGGWGGSLAAAEESASVQIVAPIINEIDHILFANPNDDETAGTAEFIELKNPNEIDIPLSAYQLLLVRQSNAEEDNQEGDNDESDTANVYRTIDLPDQTLLAGDYFVLCTDPELVFNCDFTIPTEAGESQNILDDQPVGAVAIAYQETILDAVSYGGSAIEPYAEDEASQASDDSESILIGLSRFPDGTDSENNRADWSRRCATPGLANVADDTACGPNLVVSIQANPQQIEPGAAINYTIQYTNTGFSAARNAVLFGQLPQKVNDLSISNRSGPIDITTRTSEFNGSVALLPVGDSGTFTVRGTLAPNITGGTALPAVVTLSNSLPNTTPADSISNIDILVLNIAPIGVDDSNSVSEDLALLPPLLANDTDLNGDALTIASIYTNTITSPHDTLGLVQIVAGDVIYSPGSYFQYLGVDESATDFFGYVVQDSAGLTDTASVSITILGANDPPLAIKDTFTTTANAIANIPQVEGLLINDIDPDRNDSLSIIASPTTSPRGAFISIQPNGQLSYDPTQDSTRFRSLADSQITRDTFPYTITDENGATSLGEVEMTIIGVNDSPQANEDQYKIDENNPLRLNAPGLLENDSDIDEGDVLSLKIVDRVSPTGSFIAMQTDGGLIFDPTNAGLVQALSVGQVLTETHSYAIRDRIGATATSSVTIVINGVNDPPIAVADTGVIYRENTLLIDVLANDSDIDQLDNIEVVGVNTAELLGTVTMTETGILYDPTNSTLLQSLGDDEFKIDTFTYIISDRNTDPATGEQTSIQATVTITVTGGNNAPIAQDDLFEMDEDTILNIDPLLNDSDPDLGDIIRLDSIRQPTSGTLFQPEGETALTYTPLADFYGEDSFSYTIIDSGDLLTTGTVIITVLPVNDAPTFSNVAPASDIDARAFFSYTIRATDVDATDLLAFSARQLPPWLQLVDHGNGSATISGTPSNADVGTQNITIEVSDGLITTSTTISFAVRFVAIPSTATPIPLSTAIPTHQPTATLDLVTPLATQPTSSTTAPSTSVPSTPIPSTPAPLPTDGTPTPAISTPVPLPTDGTSTPVTSTPVLLPTDGTSTPVTSMPVPLPTDDTPTPVPSTPVPLPTDGTPTSVPSTPVPLPTDGTSTSVPSTPAPLPTDGTPTSVPSTPVPPTSVPPTSVPPTPSGSATTAPPDGTQGQQIYLPLVEK